MTQYAGSALLQARSIACSAEATAITAQPARQQASGAVHLRLRELLDAGHQHQHVPCHDQPAGSAQARSAARHRLPGD